jgi:hypothetical protein
MMLKTLSFDVMRPADAGANLWHRERSIFRGCFFGHA